MKKLFAVIVALMLAFSVTSALAVIADNPSAAATQPVAQTEAGKLIGFMRGSTYCFWGVDYAYANRFEAPQPVEPWEGYKFAQSYGCISLIPDQTAVGADEFVWPHRYWIQNDHCQNLNIWTQSLDASAKKPVVIFYHGGGWNNGSSIESTAYDGQRLSEYGDVVVVTVNHRLNVVGFLDMTAFGGNFARNVGALDLAASVEWVYKNIENFGGDPGNITIFGQSGGGSKVATLLRMPAVSGMIKNAGMQSGGGLTMQSSVESAQLVGKKTAEILGLTEENIAEIQTMDYRAVYAAAQQALRELRGSEGFTFSFGPVADDENVMTEFVNTNGLNLIISGMYSENSVPSYKYGDFRHHDWTEEETKAKLAERFGDKADALLAEWQKLYPALDARELYFYNNTMNGKWNTAKGFTERGANVWLYEFDYEAPVNGGITAFHCEDLLFIFHNVDDPMCAIAYSGDPNAYIVEEAISGAWVNLLYNGTPSTDALPWAQYEIDGHQCMLFDVESKCVDHDTTAYTAILNAK